MAETSSPIVSIKVQGYNSNVVYSELVVQQPILNHHEFSFTWNIGNFKSNANFQLDVFSKYLGAIVNVNFKDNGFSGIITQLTVDERNGASQSFLVKGQSPSILLDDVPKATSYFKKTLGEIVKKSLHGAQDNMLKYHVEPDHNTESIHYLVQYNETDFQFACRLAIRYGEWFYYEGKKLIFGKPGDSGTKLQNGVDLDRLVMQANIQPGKFMFKNWDAHTGQQFSKELGQIIPSKNSFSSLTVDKSYKIFDRQDNRAMHTVNVINKPQLDSLIAEQKNSIAAKMVTVSGESKNPGLKTGCRFKIDSEGGTSEYIATSVTHYSKIVGHYENSFTAVPASVKVPPYTNPHVFRKADMQSATIKENHDPDGINRIKVQFHWQNGSDMSPWIRMGTPHAGGGKGFNFIPEKGEEVAVDFEGGDVDKPIALNGLFNGGAKRII
jgi:type VI secretion system secreted protein VgrG